MSDTHQQVAESLDLKGEVCPYTFVKSKLALEEMESGQVLRVIVDNPGSAANVPRSLGSEGHSILEVTKLNDTDWAITVKKA
jgi:TusA-related sulfurtransferase